MMEIIGVILISMLLAHVQADIGCNLRTNKDFSSRQPLVLKKIRGSDEYEFDDPDKGDSMLFKSGENVMIACPGSGFLDDKINTPLSVNCVRKTEFKPKVGETKLKPKSFKDFECNRLASSTLKRNGMCAGDKSAFMIGFEVGKIFVKTIDICFDESTYSALYAKHKINPSINGSQKVFGRTSFKEAKLFPELSINEAYTQENQKKLFAKKQSETSVLTDRKYLARGHLAPKADFVFGSQQAATFYYANAAPQWTTFNSGNWNRLESAVRRLAVKRQLTLTVYTGTHGTYQVDDADLYLARDASGKPAVAVPTVFWKVVHDELNDKAVAFVGLNDPDGDPADNPAMNVCADLCREISWVSFKPNPEIGLMYCCAVQDFSRTVTTLPRSFSNDVSLLDE